MSNATQIACPSCGEKIDVNEILSTQLEKKFEKEFSDKLQEQEKDFSERQKVLAKKEKDLEKKIEAEVDTRTEEKLKEEKSKLEVKITKKISNENSETISELEKELREKSNSLKEFNKAKVEIEKLKREKDEIASEVEAKSEKRITEERRKAIEDAEEKSGMKIRDKDKLIEDLNKQLIDAQKKVEQGSMQAQGEVQELAIESWLKEQFPLDTIEEVKKGARGADCMQTVNSETVQNCGTIYYESKRTKDFQPAWIEKFKTDMREKGADIGVIVTEAMPKGMDRMGQTNGIWICTFTEFKGLSLALRDTLLKLSMAISTQENKGDKMVMLYNYLTGNEFKMQLEAILEGFTSMRDSITKERRAMETLWKEREKQLDKVLLNTTHFYGSIKGIAGKAIPSVAMLELGGEEIQAEAELFDKE